MMFPFYTFSQILLTGKIKCLPAININIFHFVPIIKKFLVFLTEYRKTRAHQKKKRKRKEKIKNSAKNVD